MLIEGKKIAEQMLVDLAKRVKALSFTPVFADILIEGDPVAAQYVGVKQRAAERIGVEFVKVALPQTATTQIVLQAMSELKRREGIAGIIVQLPLPRAIDTQEVLRHLPVIFDVDCLGPKATAQFYSGDYSLLPPTAAAIIEAIRSTGVDLTGKNIAVVGKGQLVGKPTRYLLEKQGHQVTVIDKATSNKQVVLLQADCIVSGAGDPGFITAESVKPGAIVIDAGTSESEGQIVGDVDAASVKNKAGFLAAVPGGIGPITVAKLLENVVTVAEGSEPF